MANRERGEHRLVVDGREYVLALTMNARCELEERLSTADKDVTFREVLAAINRGKETALRAFLWACLLEHHGDEFTTPKSVGALIQAAGGAATILGALNATAKAAEPDPDDLAVLENPDDPQTAARAVSGDGPRSIARRGVRG